MTVHEDSYRKFEPYSGVAILVNPDARQVRIARTVTGTFPLFITLQGDRITASWKFEEVARAIPCLRVNVDACRLFLDQGDAAVRDQILEGVSMIWPGESVMIDSTGMRFKQSDPVEIVLPSTFADGAKATEAFLDLISEVLAPSIERSEEPLMELSGGLDSSCVAIAASRIRTPLQSYGLLHDGISGRQQKARRDEIIGLLSLVDNAYPSYETSPFNCLREVGECQNTMYDDAYRLAFMKAIDSHPVHNIDLLISGIGGDELTMTNTYVRQDWEVESRVCQSSIVAAVGRADVFMRRGIWPVHPLVHPWIVDFCRALPQAIRSKRLLHVLTLARAGLSDGFLFPSHKENFGKVILRDAWLTDFEDIFADSVIADMKIARVDVLLQQAREEGSWISIETLGRLFSYAKLDAVLKKHLGRTANHLSSA